jgi:membrane fusion protein (multidrug efflux system)
MRKKDAGTAVGTSNAPGLPGPRHEGKAMMRTAFSQAAAFLITVPLLFLSAGCNRSDSNAQPENRAPETRAVQVSVVKVEPVPIQDILVLPGETEAWEDVRVAADTTGRVEWIGPREGETARKGDLVAKIEVSALKTLLNRAEAAFKLADELYERRKKLFEKKIITEEERDRSVTERTLALTDLKKAQVEYERGFLRSPITGVVNHLFVDVGEFIERGKPMLDLVNVDKIKVNVNVPELDVRHLKAGQKAAVRVDAFPERRIEGAVDFVGYKADPATKTFPVRVLIHNAGHEIRPGMIARVTFLRRVIPDALVAPLFALLDKGGERILYVEKDGVAHARTVTIGVIEGKRVQITSGLQAGENLIVTGQRDVEEGMQVQVQ